MYNSASLVLDIHSVFIANVKERLDLLEALKVMQGPIPIYYLGWYPVDVY